MNRRTFFKSLAGVLALSLPAAKMPQKIAECYFCKRNDTVRVWMPGANPGCGYYKCMKTCYNDNFFADRFPNDPPMLIDVGEISPGVMAERKFYWKNYGYHYSSEV